MKTILSPIIPIASFAVIFVFICAFSSGHRALPTSEKPSVYHTLMALPEVSGFASLLGELGFEPLLSDSSPFTVFAPHNEAFAAAFDPVTIKRMLASAEIESLHALVAHHIVPTYLTTALVSDRISEVSMRQPTAAGDYLTIGMRDGNFFAEKAQLITNDIKASNGVIHVIDAVLTAPKAYPVNK